MKLEIRVRSSAVCALVLLLLFCSCFCSCGSRHTLWSTRLPFQIPDEWIAQNGRIIASGAAAEWTHEGAPGVLVSLDGATGHIQWEHRVAARSLYGNPVPNEKALETFSVLGPAYCALRTEANVMETIDSQNGTVRWRKNGILAILGEDGPRILVILDDYHFAVLSASDGAVLHSTQVFGEYRDLKLVRALPAEGRQFVAADSQVFAFDAASGEPLWKAKIFSPEVSLAAGEGVVIASDTGYLEAFDAATGNPLWKQSVDIDLQPRPPRIVAGVAVTTRTNQSKTEERGIQLRSGGAVAIPSAANSPYTFDIEDHYDPVSSAFAQWQSYRKAESKDLRLRETAASKRVVGDWLWGWVQPPQLDSERIYLLQTPYSGAAVLHALARGAGR